MEEYDGDVGGLKITPHDDSGFLEEGPAVVVVATGETVHLRPNVAAEAGKPVELVEERVEEEKARRVRSEPGLRNISHTYVRIFLLFFCEGFDVFFFVGLVIILERHKKFMI